jgi:hypothetical protein
MRELYRTTFGTFTLADGMTLHKMAAKRKAKKEKKRGRQKRTEAAVEEEEQEEVTYTMSMEDRDTDGVPQMLHANQGPVRHAATFHAPAP